VRSRAGKDRHRLRQHQSHLQSWTVDCDCVWTTKLSIQHQNAYYLIRIKEGDKYKTAVRATSYAVWVDERTSYHITKLQYKSEEISCRQSNDTLKQPMTLPEPKSSYTMTVPNIPERRTRVHLTTEKSSGTERAGIHIPWEESTYAPSIRNMISPPREFTTRVRSLRQREQTKQSSKRWKEVKRSTRS